MLGWGADCLVEQTWRVRAAQIGDQAHNPRGQSAGDTQGFLLGLDESERQCKLEVRRGVCLGAWVEESGGELNG